MYFVINVPSRLIKISLILAISLAFSTIAAPSEPFKLSRERFVFQTDYGDIHMAFYEDISPKTVSLIRTAVEMGMYNTNHFFRVDKGFVAQTQDVVYGRLLPLNPDQKAAVERVIPLEVYPQVKHNKRGILSLARTDDPNSGGTSFSVLLGPAPHLDMQYTIFGEVTYGIETLDRLEGLETRTEGIFVMPLKRITIQSTYTYIATNDSNSGGGRSRELCSYVLEDLYYRYKSVVQDLQKFREGALP
jgi:cyclophilin family peptidyl-prolyl cis-trans isomerase